MIQPTSSPYCQGKEQYLSIILERKPPQHWKLHELDSLKSWNEMLTRHLANLSSRFRRTISIWSCSLGRSIIPATFDLQRLPNDEIDSSGLCLMTSNSHLDTSISALKANWVKNSWATSSQVWSLEGSTKANHLWVAPLSDMGKRATNCASSIPCALMTVLYSLKWILGQPISL